MPTIIARLRSMFSRRKAGHTTETRTKNDIHVVVPDHVDLALPKLPHQEICVPASINGRDLSTGRL